MNNYLLNNKIPDIVVQEFIEICGKSFVKESSFDKEKYSKDETMDLVFEFEILLTPKNPAEISKILILCNKFNIPVTPRGGGSGVTGGALPVLGGVVLSLERLNSVVEINLVDKYAVVETGVISSVFFEKVESEGLYFPVQPSSSKMSFVGGNVAENAGSINTCKYGVTGDYVINLEVVLPTGEIIWTGSNLKKDVSGYNITQLFVGSEGTLGIITKVVYRLIKKSKEEINLLFGFKTLKNLCDLLLEINNSEIIPSGVEFISKEAVKLCEEFYKESFFKHKDVSEHLLIQLEGNDKEDITLKMEIVYKLAKPFIIDEVLIAQSDSEKKRLWKFRKGLGTILTANDRKYRDIDITVPLSAIYDYLSKLEEISIENEQPIIRFGHVLDGNIHAMVLYDKKDNIQDNCKIINDIYLYAISKGGTISGEHGIGYLQKKWMPLQFNAIQLTLFKKIKDTFDPRNILNPKKVF